ncbi:MAG: citrate synthase [Coprococcus sp.]|nr:citrate synthase [Coprococcus sp.]
MEEYQMSINNISSFTKSHLDLCIENSHIDSELYEKYGVKRGLRNINGIGINAGITNISLIKAFDEKDGTHIPCDGELYYRGYEIRDLIKGFYSEKRYGFEECTYLLLFGVLPNKEELDNFKKVLNISYNLPSHFIQDVIMKNPTRDIVSNMAKSILALGSYDKKESDNSLDNVLQQCIALISIFPRLAVYSYQGYSHYGLGKSCYIHKPNPELSFAENILSTLRSDRKYTQLEARVLDLALVLHMEHGGGSNSTFTTRIVTSSGSDTYATMTAALCSLKGPLNGGGDYKVMEMMKNIRNNVTDITNRDEISEYIRKIVKGEAFDKSGVVYGMGHPVYSVSDPRALVFKDYVKNLAAEKNMEEEFALYELIEELAPQIIAEERKIYKGVSMNIDFYSGLLYKMLKIPHELFTPLFAIARVVGWSAHRIEELINKYKIMRPAYTSLVNTKEYIKLEDRT